MSMHQRKHIMCLFSMLVLVHAVLGKLGTTQRSDYKLGLLRPWGLVSRSARSFGSVCWTERRPISQRCFRLVWNLLILLLRYSGANFIKIKATLVNWPRPTALKNETTRCTLICRPAILVKLARISLRKYPLTFLGCSKTALSVCSLLFSEAVPNNNLLLQLQLRSAGSLHVAFRNLRDSQSWGRAVVGHQG